MCPTRPRRRWVRLFRDLGRRNYRENRDRFVTRERHCRQCCDTWPVNAGRRLAVTVMASVLGALAASLAPALIVVDSPQSLPASTRIFAAVPRAPVRDGVTNISELRVSFTVYPSRTTVNSPLTFTLKMADEHAIGAFGYVVRFGDGTTRSIVVPQYCLTSPGRPQHATWRFIHRYLKAGRYRASALAYVNCTSTRVTKVVTVLISEGRR